MSVRSVNIVDWISYILFRLAEGIISVIPMRICYWIGSLSGQLLFYLLKKYRSLAIRNLRLGRFLNRSGGIINLLYVPLVKQNIGIHPKIERSVP